MKTKYLLLLTLMPCILFSTMVVAQLKKEAEALAKGLAAIRTADLKSDLYAMAGDHFKGREAGTLDELTGAMWLADQLRKAGLQPAGDNGTYFQFFAMQRNRLSATSAVTIAGHHLIMWQNVLVAQVTPANISVSIVFVNDGSKAVLDAADIKGKAVAIMASTKGLNLNLSIPERRYPTLLLNKYRDELTKRGAAAVIFVADAQGETSWNAVVPAMSRGLYDIEGGINAMPVSRLPVFWLHGNDVDMVKQEGAMLTANLQVEHFEYPSVNVIGSIASTDAVLANEYLLFSGHHDHDGIRLAYGTDSIYNGADDNASVSVALLAIARAFKQAPTRRSALFVWHGAEERGLLGSKWFSAHPTVPMANIVAVLNGDMIGRNNPDSAALLGVQPPHRNSSELVAMGLKANNESTHFKLDTLWDKTMHIEGWYFRSDHLPYARLGIPALYYTTLLHADYHTPMDEPSRINYDKLKKMTEWMYRTGFKVANANKRPALDAGFKLER